MRLRTSSRHAPIGRVHNRRARLTVDEMHGGGRLGSHVREQDVPFAAAIKCVRTFVLATALSGELVWKGYL